MYTKISGHIKDLRLPLQTSSKFILHEHVEMSKLGYLIQMSQINFLHCAHLR